MKDPVDKEDELIEISNLSSNSKSNGDEVAFRDRQDSKPPDPITALPQKVLKQHKRKILKNLAVISIAWLFLFTGYGSLQNLQSSINKDEGLGTVSVSVIYGALVASCMFIPPIAIDTFGYKKTIIGSMVCYLAYMIANFYPSWYTLIPGSAILGIGAAPLWSAKCAYLTATGKEYSSLNKETTEAVVTRFFGIFFMVFQAHQISGNAIASTTLYGGNEGNGSVVDDAVLEQCGANYCQDFRNNTNLNRPDDKQIYLMLGIFLALGIIAILIICWLLDDVDKVFQDEANQTRKRQKCSPKLLIASFRHLRHLNQILLVPLTIYSGLEQGFAGGDFTKSYVSCSLGIWMVGYVMICYGLVDSVCSFVFGRLVKYTGRIPCFIGGAVVHLATQITLLLWRPNPNVLPVYFVLAAAWGMSDAIWQTQINAFYGCLFSGDESEAAFANYRMWESVGFIVAFAYSSYICTNIKLYILMCTLIVGMLGYGGVEIREKIRLSKMPPANA